MYIFLLITIFFTLLTNVTSNIFEAWSTNKILERDGYNRETHNITTEDGFILSLHRIPGKVNSTPVLLMHGLLCDSTIWIILGKNKSLAYLLADKGYDVWLGNSRGSTYGMSHVNLTTRDFKFWDFSFNEMGVYDLPATINYITNITKQKVIVIGHSQGTRINFIMESERPEITEKVKALICLAPVAFLRHVEPHVQKFSFFLAQFLNLYRELGIMNYFGVLTRLYQTIYSLGCRLPIIQQMDFCRILNFSIMGPENEQLIDSTLQPILSNFPAGTSSKNIRHFLQGITSQTFSKYDYGETKNLEIYNSSKPPEYNLSRVTSPVALIYSEGDWYTDPMDVDALSEQLPNVVDKYKVSYQKFSHMDFLWAKDAKSLVYDHVIELVKNFTDS
ncbi:lipase 1-like isoform X1 [Microplitis mediator]|uniref:lipase 1-like isoform X1 n=1 Tax=Microplitis mediator TaxID=375433 RepID=UPI0025541E4F|nr:lipase 1-like isoform X1 [Microplitis mediator]